MGGKSIERWEKEDNKIEYKSKLLYTPRRSLNNFETLKIDENSHTIDNTERLYGLYH